MAEIHRMYLKKKIMYLNVNSEKLAFHPRDAHVNSDRNPRVCLDYKMHRRLWIKSLSLTMLINCSLSDVAPIFAFDRRRKVAEILRLQVIRIGSDKMF